MTSTGYAIITGGGSGIGREFCLALAERGWTIAVVDRSDDSAAAVAAEIGGRGGEAHAELLDVSDAQGWRELSERLQSRWPRLDLLINNAGNLLTGAHETCDLDDMRRLVEVNLLGAMYGCQALGPWLRESKGNASPRGVINIASIFAVLSPPGFAAYNAAKAGVVALTETLRGELAPHGLNATVVLPGVTPTSLFARAIYGHPHQVMLCRQFVSESTISAAMVAREALAGAARGKLYVVVGQESRWYWRLKRLAPQWLIDLVGRRAVRRFGVLGDESSTMQISPKVKRTAETI